MPQWSTVVWLFIISATAGVAAWFVFVWAIRDRQFENAEEIGRKMIDLDEANTFRDEEDAANGVHHEGAKG